MKNRFQLCALAVVLFLTALTQPIRAEEPRTEGQVSHELLSKLLAPVAARLHEAEGIDGVALRIPVAQTPAAKQFHEDLGNFFHDAGIAVWFVEQKGTPPEGAAMLNYELREFAVDYPDSRRGWLFLRPGMTLRRARVGFDATLEASGDGRRLWNGSPLQEHFTWVESADVLALAADRPDWMSGPVWAGPAHATSWVERGVVAGLVAGVAILYFDGTQ